MTGYLYILGCVIFTVYGQLVLKWRMNMQPALPDGLIDKALYLIKLILLDPFVLSGFMAAFIGSLFWMAAMTRFSISYAYPFMSSAFVLVMIGSAIFFQESLTPMKVIGTFTIVIGLVILSRGY